MSTWGTTEDWAGSGPHKTTPMGGDLVRQEGRPGTDMQMIERGTGEVLEVWRCVECGWIWFRRLGMLGFFAVQPVSKDDLR